MAEKGYSLILRNEEALKKKKKIMHDISGSDSEELDDKQEREAKKTKLDGSEEGDNLTR